MRKPAIVPAMLLAAALQCGATTPHPRIFLDADTLANARTNMGSSQWSALKAQCDGYLSGAVYPGKSEQGRYDYFAAGGDYTKANQRNPNIGLGYQGGNTSTGFNGYWDSIMNLGVCYHTILPSNPGRAAQYAAKATEIIKIISVEPGEALVLTGKKAGQKRYIYDSSFVKGTAWAGATPVVNGAVAVSAKTMPIRGLIPNGTIKAGDVFYVASRSYIAKADTTADGSGVATVTLGTVHVTGSVNSNETVPAALADGTAITTPLIVECAQHNLTTGDQVQISGVLGNTNANGTWTITVPSGPAPSTYSDNLHFILNGAPAGTALQSNLAHDSLMNQGYGARFYGVAISIAYDWFYDVISTDLRDKLKKAAIRWIQETERNGYGQGHPAGNYYAGQYVAKLFAALALEGDDAEGDKLWGSWYNNEWAATARTYVASDLAKACTSGNCMGVQKYFNTYLVDTAHPDGANYGWLATQNYLWAVMAVQSAKGIDLTVTPAPGFSWGLGAAKAIVHHTWPNRTTFNTRQKLFGGEDPARVSADALYTVSGYLRKYHPDFAPYFQSYANETIEALKRVTPYSAKAPFSEIEWNEFLFWKANAPASNFRALPLSFYSAGSGEMEMRSNWENSAVWASFIAGPTVHSVEGGKDSKDRGSLVITRGGAGFLVNASYELDKAGKVVYSDEKTLGEGVPQITNTFQVNSGARWRQSYYGPGSLTECMKPNRSNISRRSEQAGYTYARASYLEDNYYPIGYYTPYPAQSSACGGTKPMTSWTREVFYLRPKLFLVYDQTEGVNPQYDQFIAWYFPKGASPVANGSGPIRYDIKSGKSFRGTMYSILPENRDVQRIDEGDFGVVDRLEIRPPAPASSSQRWLTAFDAASSAAKVHSLTTLQGGNCDGVQITDMSTVVSFARGSSQQWPLVYSYDSAQITQHYVVGLTPGGEYAITPRAGGVSIAAGMGRAADSAGVLVFSTGSGGSALNTAKVLGTVPRGMTFECTPGEPNPEAETVALWALGGEADVSIATNAAWLSATIPDGRQTTPLTVSVQTDCSLASIGSSANLTVSSTTSGVVNSPLQIAASVELGVVPWLELDTESVSLTTLVNSAPEPYSIVATGSGAFQITSSNPWLKATPSQGSGATTVEVSAQPSGMAPGHYSGQLEFRSATYPDSPVYLPVYLDILPLESELGLETLVTSQAAVVRYRAKNTEKCRVDLCSTADCQTVLQQQEDEGGMGARRVVLTGLAPQGVYFVRPVCGAQSQTGEIRLRSTPAVGSRQLMVTSRPPARLGAQFMRVEYGTDPATLSAAQTHPCVSGCKAAVPVNTDAVYFFRFRWLDGGGTTVASGSTQVVVVP